ncbi:MAG: FHA domain-containing protein [Candidatus Binatia bacterium]
MIGCAECGHENMDGLEYCDACGAKLIASSGEDTVAAPEPVPVQVAEKAEAAPAPPEAVAEEQTASDTPEAAPVSAPAAPSASPVGVIQNAQLTITRGGTVGKVFPLQVGDNLIGRWDPDSGAFPEVDMEHDDPEARISRKHALIKVGEKITVEDIGSLNGTFVNRGARLEPGSPAELKDGDEIIVGKTFFKLSLQ